MSEQIDHRGIAVDNKRWLRNKKDGEIYGWNEIIAENPNVEEELDNKSSNTEYVNEVRNEFSDKQVY